MGKHDMRNTARQCLSRARNLLSRGDEASIRYACLELRFAIEYIAYSQLQVHIEEVSDDALKKWTPKQVISEMLEVDPHADKSVTIAVGLEHEYGVSPPPEEMQLLGQDHRFSMNWANRNHNALGNFLHAPTIHQLDSEGGPSVATIMQKATQIVCECEQILNSPVFNVNFGEFFEFDCIDCGTHVRRRIGSFTKEQGVVCPSSKCHAAYDIVTSDDKKVNFHLRQSSYKCHSCGTENWVGNHRVAADTVLECANENCRNKAIIMQRFELVTQEGTKPHANEKKKDTETC